MVFKKIIFQNRYVALETPSRPPPLHGKCHFKFPFWLLAIVPYVAWKNRGISLSFFSESTVGNWRQVLDMRLNLIWTELKRSTFQHLLPLPFFPSISFKMEWHVQMSTDMRRWKRTPSAEFVLQKFNHWLHCGTEIHFTRLIFEETQKTSFF